MNRSIIFAAAAVMMAACAQNTAEMDNYGTDLKVLADSGIETVELTSPDGQSRVMVVPCWQGRVMTSTTGGTEGASYGWVNRKFIASGEVDPQFNSFGGEERFWLGPEGGANSYYFPKGAEQIYANWKVPGLLDNEGFDVMSKSASKVVLGRKAELVNASGTSFKMDLHREVSLLDKAAVGALLGTEIPESVNVVAYKTDNTVTNEGAEAWAKETGVPSIWLLGCFNPTKTTTVFIPYNTESEGLIVKDDYFGKIPSDRLTVRDGFVFFKIDGEYRAKIGLPKGRAKEWVASYDKAAHMLTILKYTLPEGDGEYVNSQWGEQDYAFGGDVINSYNDGPTDTGVIMGPFYEIETSSPGAVLAPGESLTHTQNTLHLQGPEEEMEKIIRSVFGIGIEDIKL